jgi:UDP-glucose 4-epimerase
MKILLTGGAGFVGIHTAVVLVEAGHRVAIYDDFSNSSKKAIDHATRITGSPIRTFEGDVRNSNALNDAIALSGADSIIHLAGLKSVPESMVYPELYWDVNLRGTMSVLRSAYKCGVQRLVFSSSATVYAGNSTPLSEKALTEPATTYGRTKLAAEHCIAGARLGGMRTLSLRYFNPVGAHPSGLIGEAPTKLPQNLFPVIVEVALGKRPELVIYGRNYPTPDGTAIRDYVHVMDIARGHLAALTYLDSPSHKEVDSLNLGTGRGHSVLEVTSTFESVLGFPLPKRFADERAGDLPISVADSTLAAEVLNWRPSNSIEMACKDAWAWSQAHASTAEGFAQ